MTIQTHKIKTLTDLQNFVEGNEAVDFTFMDRTSAYGWLANTLKQFRYQHCSKRDKGLLRRYFIKVTGLSRAQMSRLIQQYQQTGRIEVRRQAPAKPFAKRFTDEDIRLLAETDSLHHTLSGPATRKLCERMFEVFADRRYERSAGISNGHLYNLRQNQNLFGKTHHVR